MIVTTTNTIEGHAIREYCGIVFGEVITGVNMFRDIGASFTNLFGGRSAGYEEELQNARNEALDEMCRRAERTGANLIQAQRDCFGAHTYERSDRPGIFHHEWRKHYEN